MENLKVRNIHDREGNSERTIMEEDDLIQAVEEWLETNTFQDILMEHSFHRYDNTFGRKQCVVVDTRDGKISHSEYSPNQYNADDSFYIDLICIDEYDRSDSDICEGATNMERILTLDQIIDIAEAVDDEEDLETWITCKKTNNGYKIDLRDNLGQISAEDWVEKILGEKWADWVESYEMDYLDGCVEYAHPWKEKVWEYYTSVREQNREE